jgi:outer membrane immunogenic protein
MRRIFLITAAVIVTTASAGAADLGAKMPVKAAPIAYWDWTGFYLGGYAGIGVQRSHGIDPANTVNPGKDIDYIGSRFTGGGTLGYNWQFGQNIVAGIEGDIGYLNLGRDVIEYQDNNTIYNSKTKWLATARGRIGWSNGPTLSYFTGGAAWVNFEDTIQNGTSLQKATSSKTKSGYAIGSGTETMLGSNWTAKAEYLFIDVGAGDPVTNPGNGSMIQTDKHRYHQMKFGVNYLFGGRPQPALPANDWSGFYAGIVGGSAVTQARAPDPTDPTNGEVGSNGTGFTVGGIAGYNWQFAPQFVAGVEGDISWLGVDHSEMNWDNPDILGIKTNWIATARGRLGYSTGPALLYVTGGGAWVNVRDSWILTAPAGAAPAISTKTLSGWTFGGGIETALMSSWLPGNWTTRTEYLYVDVGNGDTLSTITGAPLPDTVRVNHKFHLFRAALTYRFGGETLRTKY